MKNKLNLLIMVYCILFILQLYNSIFAAQRLQITEDEILGHIQSVFNEIKDYTVRIHAEIDMEEINVPPMEVTVYFKQPDKIHLQSKGFAILPREGMFINPSRFNKENFYISLLKKDTLQTIETYKMELVPRKEEITARKLIIWIDSTRWLILRVHTVSWQRQSVQIDFEYAKIQNKYWLPIKSVADIDLAGFKGFADIMKMQGHEEQKATELDTKKGKLTINFFNYKINTGLSDSIFEGK